MASRAVCVGINEYPVPDANLKGCVNDAHAWAALLNRHFDFARRDVRVIVDREATKKNVLSALDALLAGAAPGDVLVFTNSSHGTRLADVDGDEGKYDQAICPYDVPDNLLVDDELRARFSTLKPGVRLTVVSDSCFSGTVTRWAPLQQVGEDTRIRFLDPRELGRQSAAGRRERRAREQYPESAMKEVLLAACRDDQSAYDTKIGRTYHGAMSYYALQAIKRSGYRITYTQLHERLVAEVERRGYRQEPQLEGNPTNLNRQIFS